MSFIAETARVRLCHGALSLSPAQFEEGRQHSAHRSSTDFAALEHACSASVSALYLAEAPETGTATSPAQREMCTCRHSTCSVTNSHLELKNNPDHTDPQKPPAPLCSSRHTQFTASQVNTARASAIQHLYQKPGKWKNMHNMYSCKSV